MTILDTTTVSAFLVVLAVVVLAVAITTGIALRQYFDSLPARPARQRPVIVPGHGRLAH